MNRSLMIRSAPTVSRRSLAGRAELLRLASDAPAPAMEKRSKTETSR
jgi:hypothetical protein